MAQGHTKVVRALRDRAVIQVFGEPSLEFLNKLCSGDLMGVKGRKGMQQNAILPVAFLNNKGRIISDALLMPVTKNGANVGVLVDIHKEMARTMEKLLLGYKMRLSINIKLLPHARVLWDPNNRVGEGWMSDSRGFELGSRKVLINYENNSEELYIDGFNEYHTARICNAAMPEGILDLASGKALPLTSSLDLTGHVAFDKGCYVGQELTTRSAKRGASIRKRVLGLKVCNTEDGILQSGGKLVFESNKSREHYAGEILSSIGKCGIVRIQVERNKKLNTPQEICEAVNYFNSRNLKYVLPSVTCGNKNSNRFESARVKLWIPRYAQ